MLTLRERQGILRAANSGYTNLITESLVLAGLRLYRLRAVTPGRWGPLVVSTPSETVFAKKCAEVRKLWATLMRPNGRTKMHETLRVT